MTKNELLEFARNELIKANNLLKTFDVISDDTFLLNSRTIDALINDKKIQF